MSLLGRFWMDERGATSIEYAMIGLFMSILCVAGATAMGNKIQSKFLGPLAGAF